MLSWKTWICASTLSLWSTSRSQPKEGSWRQMTLLADSPAFVMNPRGLCVFLVLPEVLGESSPSEDLSACDLFCKGSLRTCNSTARSCLQKGKEWRMYVSGKRRERTKFFAFLSIQLGKKKKMPEDTQRHIGAPGLLLGGQGMAVYDEIMSDFNRTRAILKSIKDTPSP